MIVLTSTQAPKSADPRRVILAFGDSLTAGYGVPRGQGYPEQLQKKLDAKGYRYRVVNMGISGDTTSGGLARMKAALDTRPSIVILELGANDGLRGLPVKQIHANLEEMVMRFQKAGATVILAGMTLPRNYGVSYVRPFEKAFEEIAAKYKLPFITFFLQGVAGTPKYTLEDFLHPNAAGYVLVTETVMRTLEPLLKK